MGEDPTIMPIDQVAHRSNVNRAAEIPGEDPFKLVFGGQQMPDQGILVSANVDLGFEAGMEIYMYDCIGEIQSGSLPEYDQQSMYISFASSQPSRRIQCAFQNKRTFSHVSPDKRITGATCMSIGYPDLDIIDLSDGHQLLIEKKPDALRNLHVGFTHHPEDDTGEFGTRNVLRVFAAEDFAGAISAIATVLTSLVGATQADSELIITEIKNKLEIRG